MTDEEAVRLTNEQAIRNYVEFAVQNHIVSARAMHSAMLRVGNIVIKKILYVRLFFETILATETLQKIIYCIQHRSERSFIANMLDRKNNASESKAKNILAMIETSSNEFEFLKSGLGFKLTKKEYKNDKMAFDGLVLGIRSTLETRTAEKEGVERVLVKVFNKLKHGFLAFDFDTKSLGEIGIVIRKNGLIPSVKYDETKAGGWVNTIEAMRNTSINLLNMMLYEFEQDKQISG